ncbi:hypothetical protein ACFL23_03550 [Patescibacteria group bacterium]
MEEFPKFKNINNRHLGIVSQCPLCAAKVSDVKVIDEINNSFLMHSKCPKCGNAILLIATLNELGANIIGINTDLSVEEFVKFRNSENFIEIDDVLEYYQNQNLQNKNLLKEVMQIVKL